MNQEIDNNKFISNMLKGVSKFYLIPSGSVTHYFVFLRIFFKRTLLFKISVFALIICVLSLPLGRCIMIITSLQTTAGKWEICFSSLLFIYRFVFNNFAKICDNFACSQYSVLLTHFCAQWQYTSFLLELFLFHFYLYWRYIVIFWWIDFMDDDGEIYLPCWKIVNEIMPIKCIVHAWYLGRFKNASCSSHSHGKIQQVEQINKSIHRSYARSLKRTL